MDKHIYSEAQRLWDVLEAVGVSDTMRKLHREIAIRTEVRMTVCHNEADGNTSMYMFGSSSEGTTTPGMHSDEDIVGCYESFPVIFNIQEAPFAGSSLLVITDKHTRAGYVKLQAVKNGIPLSIFNCSIEEGGAVYDCFGRVCWEHITMLGKDDLANERNGPADTTTTPGFAERDQVHAFQSKAFPQEAKYVLLECVRSGWLTADDVEKMINHGCLFVGTGHPISDEKDIEWRISFSFQERQLMFSLNPTQHKCYVLLKLIKVLLASEQDVGKSITSYHCKTCLFRMILKIPATNWTPANLINCTFSCLNELLHCLHNVDLPNFFIPANNMFEKRMHEQVRLRLIHYLSNIIQEGFEAFYRIQSDGIGDALQGSLVAYIGMMQNLAITRYDLYNRAFSGIVGVHAFFCNCLYSISYHDHERYLQQQFDSVESVERTIKHTQEDVKSAKRCLELVLHKLYAQHLASVALSGELPELGRQILLQEYTDHLRNGMKWDLLSGRLLQATVLFKQGELDSCCSQLEELERSLEKAVISVCSCYGQHEAYKHVDLLDTINSDSADIHTVMKSSVAACTIFLPAHSHILPQVLQYEMHRSFGATPELRDVDHYSWYDWAVVDSKVYLYFIQYLVCSQQKANQIVAIDNLREVLQEDYNLGHRETGYNLLGWMLEQEGHVHSAAHCFVQSWRIRPQHNAAKWHMLNLIYRQYVIRH